MAYLSAPNMVKPEPNQQLLDLIYSLSKGGGTGSLDCQFDRNRINHILVYQGSFNPPHVGHLTFLRDAFTSVDSDMPFVCAFITPVTETYLSQRRFKDARNPLILPTSLRASLWVADSRLPQWTTVLDPGPDDSRDVISESLDRIKELGESFGYQVRYSLLWDSQPFQKVDRLSVSVDRRIDIILGYVYGIGDLEELSERKPLWDMLGVDKAPWSRVMVENREDEKEMLRRFHRMWTNPRTGFPRGYIRVVCASNREQYRVSLTEIRRLSALYHSTTDKLVACGALRELVLSWDLLQSEPMWIEWHGREQMQTEPSEDVRLEHKCGKKEIPGK